MPVPCGEGAARPRSRLATLPGSAGAAEGGRPPGRTGERSRLATAGLRLLSVGLGSTTTSEDGAKEEIKEPRASSLGLPAAPESGEHAKTPALHAFAAALLLGSPLASPSKTKVLFAEETAESAVNSEDEKSRRLTAEVGSSRGSMFASCAAAWINSLIWC